MLKEFRLPLSFTVAKDTLPRPGSIVRDGSARGTVKGDVRAAKGVSLPNYVAPLGNSVDRIVVVGWHVERLQH